MRFDQCLVLDLHFDHGIKLLARAPASMSSKASAWAGVRGKPVEHHPGLDIRLSMRSATTSRMMSSETRSPRSMTALALRPTSLPACNRGTQHVARGELLQAAAFLKQLGLCALSGTRRSEKDDVHRLLPRSFDFLIRPSYCWA